jgi:hypothetical protein
MVLESVVRRRSVVAGFSTEVIRWGVLILPSSAISLLAFEWISEGKSTADVLAAQPSFESLVLLSGGCHW